MIHGFIKNIILTDFIRGGYKFVWYFYNSRIKFQPKIGLNDSFLFERSVVPSGPLYFCFNLWIDFCNCEKT